MLNNYRYIISCSKECIAKYVCNEGCSHDMFTINLCPYICNSTRSEYFNKSLYYNSGYLISLLESENDSNNDNLNAKKYLCNIGCSYHMMK